MCSNVGYARQLLNGGYRQDDCSATRVNLGVKLIKKPGKGSDRRCLRALMPRQGRNPIDKIHI